MHGRNAPAPFLVGAGLGRWQGEAAPTVLGVGEDRIQRSAGLHAMQTRARERDRRSRRALGGARRDPANAFYGAGGAGQS